MVAFITLAVARHDDEGRCGTKHEGESSRLFPVAATGLPVPANIVFFSALFLLSTEREGTMTQDPDIKE